LGATLTIGGKDYDVEKDFTWEEILLVEELSGVPLGRRGAFDSMGVVGGFVFVIQKRADPALSWEKFVSGSMELPEADGDEAPKRPTRAKAA
jgi:hypothetical protein